MSDKLEWVDVDAPAHVLYPGTVIDGASVNPGEIALVLWAGSSGIAVHGPQRRLADRLQQLALVVRSAPPARQ